MLGIGIGMGVSVISSLVSRDVWGEGPKSWLAIREAGGVSLSPVLGEEL